jgi:hypothetical protein
LGATISFISMLCNELFEYFLLRALTSHFSLAPYLQLLEKMYDTLRDSALGQLIRLFSHKKVFLYADEEPGFVLLSPASDTEKQIESGSQAHADDTPDDENRSPLSKTAGHPIHPTLTSDGVVLVDWYIAGKLSSSGFFSLHSLTCG